MSVKKIMQNRNHHFAVHIVLTLLLASLLVCSALEQSKYAHPQTNTNLNNVIPIIYDRQAHTCPMVWVSINHQPPLPFELDTGTNMPIIIQPWAADKLKLVADRPVAGPYKTIMPIPNSTLRSAAVASVDIIGKANTRFPIDLSASPHTGRAMIGYVPGDTASPYRPAGVIGVQAFSQCWMTLDFTAKIMTLTYTEKPLEIPGRTPITLTEKNGIYLVSVRTETNVPINMMIDTGASAIVLKQSEANLLVPKPSATATTLEGEDNSPRTQQLLLINNLQIGDLHESNLLGAVWNKQVDSILGRNLWERFRMTFDFPHNHLWLQREPDYADHTRLPSVSTINIIRTDHGYIVDRVFYNTAADKAGIRKGDQILSIDGRAVNGLSIGFAEALLTGDANTEAVVEVERDNHKRATIKYRRESIFATSEVPHIGIGIDVAATSGGRLIISGVRDHAPGQEAGLKVNDEIVAVNDLQVASTSLDKISAQMKQPEGTVIKLTIRRQGEDKLLEFKVTVRKLP